MKFLLVCALMILSAGAAAADRPNLIFILCDDLAQGDLGCYGQKLIQTPHLDRMAAEGTRFPQLYSGTTVCAPSRSSLMTGLHTGHCPIRANREVQPEGQKPLPEETITVAQVLKSAGYATACMGKWGMGMFDTSGSPLKKGFDHFYGYNCQRHAHSYFPKYLWNDDQRVELDGKTYAQDLIQEDVEKWVRAHAAKPFFLYYAITLPHGKFEIDELGIYADKPWTDLQKTYAAMVTRLDRDVGRLMDLLVELKIDQNTLVILAGDNGASFDPKSEVGRLFDQDMGGKLRGFKRGLYEGALRQAGIAHWPGQVPAGAISEEPWAFWDYLPTAAALAGATLPEGQNFDGFDVSALLKGSKATDRDLFYWELHEGTSLQAVRFDGHWKAMKNGPKAKVELYDLSVDASESNDLATVHPDKVTRAEALMAASRTAHPDWPLVDKPKGKGKAKQGKAKAK
ncbi:MAG: arylsulfatase [Verrucomicrobiales bacterium]|nr:arylsulfatase [Verrucomicrobiales bacterium]